MPERDCFLHAPQVVAYGRMVIFMIGKGASKALAEMDIRCLIFNKDVALSFAMRNAAKILNGMLIARQTCQSGMQDR